MSAIVIVQFKHDNSQEVHADNAMRFSTDIAPSVDGLRWKLYPNRASDGAAGGVYLFDSVEHAQSYAEGDIVASMRERYPDVSVEVYDNLDDASRATGAPIDPS